MFALEQCHAEGCALPAATGSSYCLRHDEENASNSLDTLSRSRGLSDFSVAGGTIDSLDLSDRHFSGVCFSGCSFSRTLFRGSSFDLCFFDGSTHVESDFSECRLRNCVFGGTRISDSRFVGSTTVQCNFNGASISNCDFSSSDLLHSRFINADLDTVQFVDCNLKAVFFFQLRENNLTFKYSNDEEAHFIGTRSPQ